MWDEHGNLETGWISTIEARLDDKEQTDFSADKTHTHAGAEAFLLRSQDQLTLYPIQENEAQSSTTITGIHTLNQHQ